MCPEAKAGVESHVRDQEGITVSHLPRRHAACQLWGSSLQKMQLRAQPTRRWVLIPWQLSVLWQKNWSETVISGGSQEQDREQAFFRWRPTGHWGYLEMSVIWNLKNEAVLERRKRQRYRLNKILGDGETACLIRVEFVCVCVCACVRACVRACVCI